MQEKPSQEGGQVEQQKDQLHHALSYGFAHCHVGTNLQRLGIVSESSRNLLVLPCFTMFYRNFCSVSIQQFTKSSWVNLTCSNCSPRLVGSFSQANVHEAVDELGPLGCPGTATDALMAIMFQWKTIKKTWNHDHDEKI